MMHFTRVSISFDLYEGGLDPSFHRWRSRGSESLEKATASAQVRVASRRQSGASDPGWLRVHRTVQRRQSLGGLRDRGEVRMDGTENALNRGPWQVTHVRRQSDRDEASSWLASPGLASNQPEAFPAY